MTGRTPNLRTPSSGKLARHHSTLRSGTAMAAALIFSGLAFAGLAAPARAQGFNGTITSSIGVNANPGNTDFTVLAQEAIINWDANGAAPTATDVDFLPVSGSVLFHTFAGSNFSTYTVLNRINPTYTDTVSGATTALAATISLSGTVNSTVTVQDPISGLFSDVQGGSIWFYSPYGVIANGTAAFNVGSLLLTTSDIDTSNGGSLYLNSPSGGKRIGFLPATQPGGVVKIAPGALLNAAGDPGVPNSGYVGVFAPRIEQGGTIAADGMAALVAGEAGTITFNLGLIDVAVTTGTTDANGIVHTGSTGGPASSGEAQTVALVAMPQNTALTMLLGGSIGYTPAAIAVPDGSAVVLNAGYDPALPAATLAAGLGNITIANTTFTNGLTARATGAITVAAPVPGLTDFQRTADLYAGRAFSLTANAGQEIRARDSLFLSRLLPFQAPDATVTVTGATPTIPINGLIDVTNTFNIDAGNIPDFLAPIPATGTAATGGTVEISVDRGTLNVGGSIGLYAIGIGESGTLAGGTGSGGQIEVIVGNNGTISTPFLFVQADGSGGFSPGSPVVPGSGNGGDGVGGTVILADGTGDAGNGFGTLALGDVSLFAEGSGTAGAATSGNGLGGNIAITLGRAQTWNTLIASASAYNGTLLPGATGLGNATGLVNGVSLTIEGLGASLDIGSVSLDNSAYMNIGSTVAHSAQAGDISITARNGGRLTVTGALTARADANLTPDGGAPPVVVAPSMTGGSVIILASGGTIAADTMVATAQAWAVAASLTGALGSGGAASIGAELGGTVSFTGSGASVVSADAFGAVGPVAGDAEGGLAEVFAIDGTITAPTTASLVISASARSGGIGYSGTTSQGTGFNATGGDANLFLQDGGAGTGSITLGTVNLRAKGNATVLQNPNDPNDPLTFTPADIIALQGNGGTGQGGTAAVVVDAGTLTVGTLTIHANGIGGTSGFNAQPTGAFVSGDGIGGIATLDQTGGTIGADVISLRAGGHGGGYVATGGFGEVLPLAGDGFGGVAQASLLGGTMTLGTGLQIVAGAIGGDGSGTSDPTITGGTGGNADASAGLAELLMPAGSTALLTSPGVTVDASALGGAGGVFNGSGGGIDGNGGNAVAGTARFTLADGGFALAGGATAAANATGGAGDTGGDATAGTAGFILADTLAAPSTTRAIGPLLLSATPTGGTGPTASGTTTAGATLFTARAGRLASALTITGDFIATAPGTIAPAGDGFTGDFGAIPVTITGNALIDTPRDVTITVATGGGLNIGTLITPGTLTINGRTVTSTGGGVLAATGNVAVNATTAINMAGLSAGGTTLLVAQDPVTTAYGPVQVSALNSVGLVTVQSSAFDAVSSGALSFANSFATVGAFTVTTAGNLDVSDITAGGAVSLTSIGGGVRNTGTVSAATTVTLDAGTNVAIDGALGVPGLLTVNAGGVVTATVPVTAGSVAITGTTGITIANLTSFGTTDLQAPGGAILINELASSGPVTLSGRSAQVGSSGTLTVTSAIATAGDLSVQGANGLSVGTASATGNLTLGSSAGAVTTASTVSANGDATIFAGTGITMASLSAGGTTDLQGGSGAVAVTSLSSTGSVFALGNGISIGSPGALTFSTADAGSGNLIVTAAGSLGFGSASAGALFSATSGGLFSLSGGALADAISVTAADIQIGATAQLGARGRTTSIALDNRTGGATFVGGTGQAGAWSLDASEAARLFADQWIAISASPAVSGGVVGNVTIDTLSLSYGPANPSGPSANIGTSGFFDIGTPGTIRVTGAVALTSSAPDDTFGLFAGTIDVVGPAGSIAMLDANGGLSGRLSLSADLIRAGSAAALADISGSGSVTDISNRLGMNDGITSQTGYLRANAIALFADSGLFIQNTGVSDLPEDRRGFTANSLDILSEMGEPAIAINGVITGPNGGLVTGLDTQKPVRINGVLAAPGGAFRLFSTINGCVIGGDCSTIPPVVIIPSRPIIEFLPMPPGAGGPDPALNLPVVQYGSSPLLDSPPLIDEPVTGVGNDDLWQPLCRPDTDCRR